MKTKYKYLLGGAAIFAVVLVSALTYLKPSPDVEGNAASVGRSLVPAAIRNLTDKAAPVHAATGNYLSVLYRNQANQFALDFSAVINLLEASGAEKVFMDANVLGDLHLVVLEENNKTLAVAKITNPDIFVSNGEKSLMDENKADLARAALEIPFGFEYDAEGTVKNIMLSSQEDTFTAGVKRALASRLQFASEKYGQAIKPGAAFEKQEANETGIYIAHYKTQDQKTYNKTISRFVELAAIAGAKPTHSIEQQQFFGTYGLNAARALEYLTATASVVTKADTLKFKADSELSMQWAAKSPLHLTRDMLAGYTAFALHQMPAAGSAPDQKLAEHQQISAAEFSASLAGLSLDKDRDEIWRLREAFIQSVLSNPGNLTDLQKLFEGGLSDEQQSIYLGALKDAGTAEAQAEIIKIASNEKIDMETRKHALSHLNFLQNPTESTLEYLEGAVANTGMDPELKATAILALGGVARAGLMVAQNTSDASAAQRFGDAVTRLEQGYAGSGNAYEKTAYLMGLGNAGHETSTGLLMQLTASEDSSMRALAVDSLRFHKSELVDQKVVALMSEDQDIGVQVSAARSTVYREANPILDTALLQTAKTAQSEDVRLAALSSLDFRNEDSAVITQEIQTISQKDASPKVREFAEQLYQGRTSQENVSSIPQQDISQAGPSQNMSDGYLPEAGEPAPEFSITKNPGTEVASENQIPVPGS